MQQRYRVDFSALMRLYETNYAKLVRLMPAKKTVGAKCAYDIHGQHFQIIVLEATRYTTLLSICLKNDVPSYLKPRLTVRLYHDAKVAEVCSSQQVSQLKARYDYPNLAMHQQNEKHQINVFLSDWLIHCLKNGTIYSY